MPRSTALHMSYRVSAATPAAVSASISTPVTSFVSTAGADPHAIVDGLEIDARLGDRERMAEGNEVARSLRRHDAGHSSDGEHVTLGRPPFDDHRQRLGAHVDDGSCDWLGGG